MQNERNNECGAMVVVMATVAVGLTVTVIGPLAGPICLAAIAGGLVGVMMSETGEEETAEKASL